MTLRSSSEIESLIEGIKLALDDTGTKYKEIHGNAPSADREDYVRATHIFNNILLIRDTLLNMQFILKGMEP